MLLIGIIISSFLLCGCSHLYTSTLSLLEYRNLKENEINLCKTNKKFYCSKLIQASILYGRYETLKMIFNKRVDINIRDEYNRTPLMWYVRYGEDNEGRNIFFNADFNLKDNDGNTALHHAVMGDSNNIEFVLNRENILITQNNEGMTPLMISLRERKNNKLLLERSCDMNIRNNKKENIFNIAFMSNDRENMKNILKTPCVNSKFVPIPIPVDVPYNNFPLRIPYNNIPSPIPYFPIPIPIFPRFSKRVLF